MPNENQTLKEYYLAHMNHAKSYSDMLYYKKKAEECPA